MSSRHISLGTPYRWLGEAFAMFRAHTGVLFGAALLAVLVALLPSVLQLVLELLLTPSGAASQMIELLCLLLGLVLFPPVVGGFYRLVHALQAGRAATALDVLAVFQDGPAAVRLIITNLVFTLITLLLAGAIAYAVGGPELFDFLRAMAALKPDAATLPALPGGLFSTFALVLAVGLLIGTAQGLAMVQVAVAGRAPAPAIGEGFLAMGRNLGALLLFYLPVALIGGVIFLVFGLIAALIGAVLSAISPALTMALVLPLALGLVVALYAVGFNFIYHAWRELFGAAPPTPTNTQIAV